MSMPLRNMPFHRNLYKKRQGTEFEHEQRGPFKDEEVESSASASQSHLSFSKDDPAEKKTTQWFTSIKEKFGILSTAEFVEFFDNGHDDIKTIWHETGIAKGSTDLCSGCRQIPFQDCLPLSGAHGDDSANRRGKLEAMEMTFYMPLEKILKQREWCKFCRLLFQSVCRPENDLLRPPHISKHLTTSDKLKDLESFKEWTEKFPMWKRFGEASWPFGYTSDPKEAAKAAAKELARQMAEQEEEKEQNEDHLYKRFDQSSSQDLANAAHTVSLGLGIGNIVAKDENLSEMDRKALLSAQLATSHLAFLSRRRRPLTCWFIIKAHRRDHTKAGKAGLLSVRVYGHGRAPRAPMKEICHFCLRLERSGLPREDILTGQIWYGRPLRRQVDFDFFRTCSLACKRLHGDSCNKFIGVKNPASQASKTDFRLVDVEEMRVIETDFEEIIAQKEVYPYIALSYCWGLPDSKHAQLNKDNRKHFLKVGGLNKENGVYIPQTIKDAIKVVKEIGVTYLWVDSLCIIQDKKHPDKEANFARMGRIYGEALFTIVAGDSKKADAGFLRGDTPDLRSGVQAKQVEQTIETILDDIQVFLPVTVPQDLMPWDSRAWTFQEKMLSARMLVFSEGLAVWHCKGGVWREDVNAQDVDVNTTPIPCGNPRPIPADDEYLHELVKDGRTRLLVKDGSARLSMEDGSTRLFRHRSFQQYVGIVEDFSRRDIRSSWEIMDAFKGLQSVLESEYLLNSPLRHGLPTRFIDIALLWQPKGPVTRRKNDVDDNGRVFHHCPPSWTWAGWEAVSSGSELESESKGGAVCYDSPFEVDADEHGLLMRLVSGGEERVRPLHRCVFIAKSISLGSRVVPKLEDIGLLGKLRAPTSTPKDWKSQDSTPPSEVNRAALSDRHLVFQTELAKIQLGNECFRIRTRIKSDTVTVYRETISDVKPSPQQLDQARERWILDATSGQRVGTVRLHSNHTTSSVDAIILSEAQYLGNELRVDVLGYPLYNIMVISRRKNGIAERIGLGKMYKYAWENARPQRKEIALE